MPTRDRAERLRNLLGALASQTLPAEAFEVIVVDDGSTDGTGEVLTAAKVESPFALTAVPGPRRGPAAARNAGWRLAGAPIVAFTDDDCEPDSGWLASGLDAVEATGGAVQGRTLPIPREAVGGGIRSRTKRIDRAGPWYQTCNIFYPRATLERLEGFDEAFRRPFGEDADLAWRAIESGEEISFEPRALVHHAVEHLSIRNYLDDGMRDPDEAIIFRRHRGLRARVVRLGVFKSDHHALLPLAVAGAVAARRWRPAVVLALPYLLHAAVRCRAAGSNPASIPALAAHDALELASAAHGALRHRVPVI